MKRSLATLAVALLLTGCPDPAAPRYDLPPRPGYWVAGSRTQVVAALEALGWDHLSSHRRAVPVTDTLQGLLDKSYAVWIAIRVELRDAPTCGTEVIPFDIQTLRRTPDLAAIRQRFEREVIQSLKSTFPEC